MTTAAMSIINPLIRIDNLRRKAMMGDAQAQFELALAYENGDGVPEDKEQAAEWFGKAAGGDEEAREALRGLRKIPNPKILFVVGKPSPPSPLPVGEGWPEAGVRVP